MGRRRTGGRGRSLTALAVAVAVTSLVTLAAPAPAGAAVLVTDTPVAGWRVEGVTYAVRVVGNITYVGGTFARVVAPDGSTRPRANLAAFDTRTGALVEGFRADTNGQVRALVSDGSTLWVSGSFTTIGGVSRSRIAALDPASGAVRPGFVATANSHVYGMDLRAGRLFLAGSFSMIGSTARNRAAAVDPGTGAVDAAWNPNLNGTALAVRANPTGSVVYLGGDFTAAGTAARTGVAAVTGTNGAPTATVFADTYRPTFSLDMNESGSRLFAAVGGPGNQVAAWDTSTGRKLWRQRADGDVQAVAYHRDTVYFGFHESFAGDLTLRLLAANAADGVLDAEFRPTFDRFWGIHAISATDAAVAGAGDFTRVSGVAAQGIALFPPASQTPPPPAPVAVEYLGAASTWRYFDRGSATGSWTATAYDDSTWASGRPQFGYGDGDETTVVSFGPDAARKYITTYFRTTFQVAQRPTRVTLSLVADDGAVVYLNGVELLRDNMPTGAVTSATLAATNRSGTAETQVRTFTVDPARLVVGTNTVAVEVHQDYQGSSDLSLDLGLRGETPA